MTNLENVYAQANNGDFEVGLGAYPKYRRLTFAIAERYGFPGEVGAAVFAALSPNNDYFGNLRDTERVLNAARKGQNPEDFKVSTYTANKIKAWRIATGEKPLDLIVARKTRNFFLNINDPTDPHPVTVDGHMYWIWMGRRDILDNAKVTASTYDRIAEDLRVFAASKGLVTCAVQGVLWHTWKRIHRILFNSDKEEQKEMWDREAYQIGLGWQMVQRTGIEPVTPTVSR